MLITTAIPIPAVTSLADCASYANVVAPYIPQLKELPGRILQAGFNRATLTDVYLTTNPLVSAFAFALFLAPIFLVVSEVNKNYSQVDRCWSILPTVWIAHYVAWAHLAGIPTKRLDNILLVGCLWTTRLTFNYWRKGGYSVGSEDYRWEIIRQKVPAPLFFVFNVLFISTAQSLLLCAVTTPVYVLTVAAPLSGDKMSTADLIFSRIMMLLVVIEFFSDQQQWNFQNAKKYYQDNAKVPSNWTREHLERGFVTTGLWRYSRHPNFAAEQAFWFLLYQWCCYETFSLYNWTFAGTFSYLFLFQASTWFTELISAGKYDQYKEYQKSVAMFVPKPWTIGNDPVPKPRKS